LTIDGKIYSILFSVCIFIHQLRIFENTAVIVFLKILKFF
jgi:hypothetical protein